MLKWAHLTMTLKLATTKDWLADLKLADLHLARYYTFWDMKYYLVWILVQSQTDVCKAMHIVKEVVSSIAGELRTFIDISIPCL